MLLRSLGVLLLLLAHVSAVDICKGEGPRYGDYRCNHDATHRVCAKLKDDMGNKLDWSTGKDFWQTTVRCRLCPLAMIQGHKCFVAAIV